MRSNNIRLSVCVSLLLVVVCQCAVAQVTQDVITGLVSDSTGAVVAGAKVVTRNVATGMQAETVSSSTGNYQTNDVANRLGKSEPTDEPSPFFPIL